VIANVASDGLDLGAFRCKMCIGVHPLQDVSFTAQAAMIAEVLDALGIDKVDLVGRERPRELSPGRSISVIAVAT